MSPVVILMVMIAVVSIVAVILTIVWIHHACRKPTCDARKQHDITEHPRHLEPRKKTVPLLGALEQGFVPFFPRITIDLNEENRCWLPCESALRRHSALATCAS